MPCTPALPVDYNSQLSNMRRADVLVVGGGVIGSSIAYNLAKRGAKNIVVIDKSNMPGAGTTGTATGGFRTQFSSEINVQLSLLALDVFKTFKEETGVDPGYDPRGYLFLASTQDEMQLLRRAISVQHQAGAIETRTTSRS